MLISKSAFELVLYVFYIFGFVYCFTKVQLKYKATVVILISVIANLVHSFLNSL